MHQNGFLYIGVYKHFKKWFLYFVEWEVRWTVTVSIHKEKGEFRMKLNWQPWFLFYLSVQTYESY